MARAILRLALAIGASVLLASCGARGNAAALQTLFTVLGIAFSASMSLLVSFSLEKVLNKKIRDSLRASLAHARNMLLLDFSASSLASVAALAWDSAAYRYELKGVALDVMLMATMLASASLAYEAYSLCKLHRLHTDIEEAVLAEEANKARLT